MANRPVRIITKRTSVPGKIPTGTTGNELNLVQVGELATNLADKKIFSYDGANIFEFGSNSFLSLTGGTVTGNTVIIGGLTSNTFSANSISGNSFYHNNIDIIDNLYDLMSNGIIAFSGITTASTTTFNVNPAKAWFVDNISSENSNNLRYVYFSGQTGVTTPYLSSSTETFIMLTSASTLYLSSTFPTPQERRQYVYLGKLGHADKSTIINTFNEPDFGLSPMSQLRDMFTSFKLINGGIYASPNGVNLNINKSAGILYGLGIGVSTSSLNPNSLSISATSPSTFQYRTQTGGSLSNTTLVDPANYDVAGVITPVGGGSNASTNQRIYLLQNGQLRIQYGQVVYSNLTEAIAGAQTESFVPFPNFLSVGILIGILSVNKNATDLSNTSQARFLNASKIGESIGSAGGISTTTLQQAYNNSVNPEIITNSTLDGVQFRGGTGNNNDYNIVIENNAGTLTGGWKANGGLTANTISGGTIYSGNTNLYDIFLTSGNLSGTSVSSGSNIAVQQTGSDYKVSVVASPSLNSLTLSGSGQFAVVTATSLSSTTISGGTIYSGNTNLYDIFQPLNKSPYNTYVLTAGTSYTFTGTVNTLSIYKTVGSSTQVNLPTNPSVNDFYIVKDRKGDSNLNPITVSGGTKTIDGATSYVIKLKTKPSLTFLFDGFEYIVI